MYTTTRVALTITAGGVVLVGSEVSLTDWTTHSSVFPIFEKRAAGEGGTEDQPFRWLIPSLSPTRSCLHGVHLTPTASSRVAAFDLDGTIIKDERRVMKKVNEVEWEWWKAVVPQKLKEVHNSGYSIVLISNQNLKPAGLVGWKKKISIIAAAIPELPFRIFAATAKDGHRKPMPGMWFELERIFAEDGITIDKSTSYYVGDAAGRSDDFASTDRKFAINVGVQFYTPEEYFLEIPPAPYTLPGFHVSTLEKGKSWSPSSTYTLYQPPKVVLFVGPPCLGKSTFYRTHFAPAGYVHVNQDTLGSRLKCVKAAEEALVAGKSCVIDNTNRDVQTRKYYLDIAKRFQVPARCFVFQGSTELSWHNNLYRAYARPASVIAREPARALVPYAAIVGFADAYKAPSVKEGFTKVLDIPWVFEGSEEERRHWNMWLQIDGK
ncbi:polynucleotide kinase 3 phosphatase-domain-containing protein [Multifurca ochricompacta]|uniref:Polynucleotide kinase 3 phosphatase-domain-containing protein n=1 Tax=Multifurca ochricompacta TaxID=376703 RepID=A0AAD4M3N6_9AGAM|nr:polynucleotide kinase 3 phosphatase-domain-containing protein [Multifurca ochricompacta]